MGIEHQVRGRSPQPIDRADADKDQGAIPLDLVSNRNSSTEERSPRSRTLLTAHRDFRARARWPRWVVVEEQHTVRIERPLASMRRARAAVRPLGEVTSLSSLIDSAHRTERAIFCNGRVSAVSLRPSEQLPASERNRRRRGGLRSDEQANRRTGEARGWDPRRCRAY